jgi:hypothetical protein
LKRYPEAKESRRGNRIEWQTAAGGAVMELQEARVAILEGVPARANTNQLLRKIWQQ